MNTDYGIPVVSRPGERERVDYYGTAFDVVLRAETTGGQYFGVAQTHRPEDAPPFHVHTREDELWIVQEGTYRFWIGGTSLDTAQVSDVGPGGIVYGPRNIPHTFQVLGESGAMVILWNPAGSQRYFLRVGSSEHREDFAHLERLEEIGVRVWDRAPVNGA